MVSEVGEQGGQDHPQALGTRWPSGGVVERLPVLPTPGPRHVQ